MVTKQKHVYCAQGINSTTSVPKYKTFKLPKRLIFGNRGCTYENLEPQT